MKNSKKIITYMVVAALVMALSISCKNDETDPNAGNFKPSDLVGTWTGDMGSFTINSSGVVNFTYQGTTYDKNILAIFGEEETSILFTSSLDNGHEDFGTATNGEGRKIAEFLFKSSSSCDVTIKEQKYSGEYPNGSWQTQNTIPLGTFTK